MVEMTLSLFEGSTAGRASGHAVGRIDVQDDRTEAELRLHVAPVRMRIHDLSATVLVTASRSAVPSPRSSRRDFEADVAGCLGDRPSIPMFRPEAASTGGTRFARAFAVPDFSSIFGCCAAASGGHQQQADKARDSLHDNLLNPAARAETMVQSGSISYARHRDRATMASACAATEIARSDRDSNGEW